MNVWLIFALALAGGVGAVLRFTVDTVVSHFLFLSQRRKLSAPGAGHFLGEDDVQKVTCSFSSGIVLVNISGCFLAGIITGLAASGSELNLILGTGFLGGYTTFSTAMVDVIALQKVNNWAALVLYLGVFFASVIACMLGLWAVS